MAEGSSNQDYGANYTVDDDDFDISSDDDDTFDENDITPRDATQVNSSALGLRHIDSAMLLAKADRLSTDTTTNSHQGDTSPESNSTGKTQETFKQPVVTDAPLLQAKTTDPNPSTIPRESIMLQSKKVSKEPHVSPSRKHRDLRKEETLRRFKNNIDASNVDNTELETDQDEALLGVTEEMLEEEEKILEKACQAQRLVSKATKMSKRANVPINSLHMVDKTGKLVSFEELQTDIDAALEVRRNRKDRSRMNKAKKLKDSRVSAFNVVDLSEVLARHPEEQMRFAFQLADINSDGRVTKEEIKESIKKFQLDEEDTEEDWALQQFKNDVDRYFLSGGCKSDYVDEEHLEASKYAEMAVGAPLSVSVDELIALQQWTDDVEFYKQVFTKKFLDRLSKAFIGASHETAYIGIQCIGNSHEDGKAPWIDKSILSASTKFNVSDSVGAILNTINVGTIQTLIRLIELLQSKCKIKTSSYVVAYLKENFIKMDLTNASYVSTDDFKRVLGKNGHGVGLNDEDVKFFCYHCREHGTHDHIQYLELCKLVENLMVCLEGNESSAVEKLKQNKYPDDIFSDFVEKCNNAYDQWDLFSAALCCKAWVLLNYILADELLSEMIAPHPSRISSSKKIGAICGVKCSIPIHNLQEMKDPYTNKYTVDFQSSNFSSSLWEQQKTRDFTYLIEPVENYKGGLRMKTKATEETDNCSDAIVWVRLLSYLYDHRAHLRKDCLTKKEHAKLVKVNRMNNMARAGTKKLSKYEIQLQKEAEEKKRKERKKAKELAKNPVSFVERMEKKIEESRRKKINLRQRQAQKIKEDALQNRSAGRPDTLGFLKRLQMNEDLKEKKRQELIKAEMLSHRKAGHRVDKVKAKMQRLSKSISTEKKTMAKNAFSKYDRDQSGWIDATELKIMVEDLGEPVSDLEVQRLVKKLDKNNDGTIGFEEFMEWFLCRCPACKYIMERDPIPGRNYRKFALTTDDCVRWAQAHGVLDFNGTEPSPGMLICGSCLDVYKRRRFLQRLEENEERRREKRRLIEQKKRRE